MFPRGSRPRGRRARSPRLKLAGAGLAVVVLAVGCGASDNDGSTGAAGSTGSEASPSAAPGGTASGAGRTVQAGDAGEAVVWGDHAEYGVVMSHGAAYDAASWAAQGTKIADNGMVALAVEDNSADSLAAAARYLTQQYGVEGVALMGASAGGQTAIQAAAQHRRRGRAEADDRVGP